jgi:hypothetical protein
MPENIFPEKRFTSIHFRMPRQARHAQPRRTKQGMTGRQVPGVSRKDEVDFLFPGTRRLIPVTPFLLHFDYKRR